MLKVGPAAGLEQLTLLARSARGAGAAELVRQALEAPGVLVFGEPTVLAAIEQQVGKVQVEQAGQAVHQEELAARVDPVTERLNTRSLLFLPYSFVTGTTHLCVPFCMRISKLYFFGDFDQF